MSKILIAFLITLGLSACAGKVKQVNCAESDWVAVGYKTALEGKSIRTFDTYIKACGSELSPGAKDAYIDGYTKGVIEFCTFEKGFEYGSNNYAEPNVCPYEVRADFSKGYKQGALNFSEKMRLMKSVTTDRPEESLDEKPSPGGNPNSN